MTEPKELEIQRATREEFELLRGGGKAKGPRNPFTKALAAMKVGTVLKVPCQHIPSGCPRRPSASNIGKVAWGGKYSSRHGEGYLYILRTE